MSVFGIFVNDPHTTILTLVYVFFWFILSYVALLILLMFTIKSISLLFEYGNIVLFGTAFDFLCVKIVR
jgi:hypothetical protein